MTKCCCWVYGLFGGGSWVIFSVDHFSSANAAGEALSFPEVALAVGVGLLFMTLFGVGTVIGAVQDRPSSVNVTLIRGQLDDIKRTIERGGKSD